MIDINDTCNGIKIEFLIAMMELVIFQNRISDISKSNYWYQEVDLQISQIRIDDVTNSISDITIYIYWYQ